VLFVALGILYTFSVQMAWMRGFPAGVTPFLAIPADRYYFWQRFYQVPLFLVTFIVFAGTARLVATAFGGRGAFEHLFALCATAMTLPMTITMWIPETVYFFAAPTGWSPAGGWGVVWLVFTIARQVAGMAWPLALIGRGIAASERIGGFGAAVVTTVGFLPAGALMVLFIR
jgi:hypothetical protein